MRDINFKYYFTLNDKVINTKTFIMDDIEDINFNTILFLNIDTNKYSIEKMKLYRSQSTGLKDKNGVEIYEGDVIVYISDCDKDKNKNIAIVEFSTNNFRIGFKLNPIKETEINFGEDVDGDCCIINFSFYDEIGQNFTWDNLEVIGNIYENPELLKEGI